jgi:hypothetical protein
MRGVREMGLPYSKPKDTGAIPLVAAIDVAGPGEDETVLGIRQGNRILHQQAFSAADARGPVKAVLSEWAGKGLQTVNMDRPASAGTSCRISEIGGVLLESASTPSTSGKSPRATKAQEKYVNLRAELYWHLRDLFADGHISGLTDQVAIAQLAGIRYEHKSDGELSSSPKRMPASEG